MVTQSSKAKRIKPKEQLQRRSSTQAQERSPEQTRRPVPNDPYRDILMLQQAAGNQAVSQLLQSNRGRATEPVATPPAEVISGAPTQQVPATQVAPNQPEAKSSILGLTAEKLQLAVGSLEELLPSADQEEAELIEQLVEQEDEILTALGQQSETFSVNIPIDDSLLQSIDINRELSLQFLQIAFAPYGIKLEREMAESIVNRQGWTNFASQEKVRAEVTDRLAKGMKVIPYLSTSKSLMTAVQDYYQIRRERIQRLRRAYEELHKNHYAEDAILDFYIAHYNGLVGVLNGILDLPAAPVNLYEKLSGKPIHLLDRLRGNKEKGDTGVHLLGRIPKLEYRGEYGQKYGHTMEAGVAAGLILASGKGALGKEATELGVSWLSRLASTPVGARILKATEPGVSWLSRLASTPVGARILKATRAMLLGDTVSYSGIAALDIRQATQELADLEANICELPDGTLVRKSPDGTEQPITVDQIDDKVSQLLEQILVSAFMVYGGLKAARQLGKKPAAGKEKPSVIEKKSPVEDAKLPEKPADTTTKRTVAPSSKAAPLRTPSKAARTFRAGVAATWMGAQNAIGRQSFGSKSVRNLPEISGRVEAVESTKPGQSAAKATSTQAQTKTPGRIASETKSTVSGESAENANLAAKEIPPLEQRTVEPISATAVAEGQITSEFLALLNSGKNGAIKAEGVLFAGVRVMRIGNELVVRRFGIKRQEAPKGHGRVMQDAYERAAAEAARQVGAKSVRILMEKPVNSVWRAEQEQRGYAWQTYERSSGITESLSEGLMTKVIELEAKPATETGTIGEGRQKTPGLFSLSSDAAGEAGKIMYWGSVPIQERIAAVKEVVNHRLSLKRVPEVKVNFFAEGEVGRGKFAKEDWSISLKRDLFVEDKISEAEHYQLIEDIYHETQHAIDVYNAARLKAVEYPSADALANALKIEKSVCEKAFRNRMSLFDPLRTQTLEIYESIWGKEQIQRRVYNEIVEAKIELMAKQATLQRTPKTDVAGRRKALEDLWEADQNYGLALQKYKNLPEERSAIERGIKYREFARYGLEARRNVRAAEAKLEAARNELRQYQEINASEESIQEAKRAVRLAKKELVKEKRIYKFGLRHLSPEQTAIKSVSASRKSLDNFLDRVWAEREHVVQQRQQDKPVYFGFYSKATESNPLTKSTNEHLREVIEIGRGSESRSELSPDLPGFIHFNRASFDNRRGSADLATLKERVYLNVSADHAPEVMHFVVREIIENPNEFPKVPVAKITMHGIGERSEGIVIYTQDQASVDEVHQKIRQYQSENPTYFMTSTPPMTEPVLPGVSIGSQPIRSLHRNKSFGEVRSAAIEEALREAVRNNETQEQFKQRVLELFRQHGIDPDNPHLNLTPGDNR
jgi:tetratricopeptide (TPR) repeat protein